MGTQDRFHLVSGSAAEASGRAGSPAPKAGWFRPEPETDGRPAASIDRAAALRYCITRDLI